MKMFLLADIVEELYGTIKLFHRPVIDFTYKFMISQLFNTIFGI